MVAQPQETKGEGPACGSLVCRRAIGWCVVLMDWHRPLPFTVGALRLGLVGRGRSLAANQQPNWTAMCRKFGNSRTVIV